MEQEIDWSYERSMNHTYLVCDGMMKEDDYEIQMILNNQIAGILPSHLDKIDGKIKLYYEISSKQPLRRIYDKKKMDYKSLEMLLSSLQKVIIKMEEFLLTTESLIMNPDMIYVDLDKKEVCFCLLPGFLDRENTLHRLMEFILECVDYSDEKAVAAAYEWYKKTDEDNFSYNQVFSEVFEEKEQKIKTTENDERIEHMEEITNDIFDVDAPEETEEHKFAGKFMDKILGDRKRLNTVITGGVILAGILILIVLKLICNWSLEQMIAAFVSVVVIVGYFRYRQNADDEEEELDFFFEEDIDLNMEKPIKYEEKQIQEQTMFSDLSSNNNEAERICEYGETVFFDNLQMEIGRVLKSVNKQFEDCSIKIFPFVLGKLQGAVDGVINHETVSRIHCKIELENGEYYITDLNSTNGTIVNEVLLKPNESIKLQIGDEVQIGQARYVFQ